MDFTNLSALSGERSAEDTSLFHIHRTFLLKHENGCKNSRFSSDSHIRLGSTKRRELTPDPFDNFSEAVKIFPFLWIFLKPGHWKAGIQRKNPRTLEELDRLGLDRFQFPLMRKSGY